MKKVLLLSGKVACTEADVYIEVSSPKGTPKAEFLKVFKKLEKVLEGEIVDGQDRRT